MTRPLLVATRSRSKQAEFRRLLAPLGRVVAFPDDLGLEESDTEHGLEAFDTFEANARAKAEWFASLSGLDTVADDSGLEVDALGGAPGVRSKRFAGRDGPDHEVTAANNAELLHRLRHVAGAARGARYRCVLVCVRPGGPSGPPRCHRPIVTVTGVAAGRILEAPVGDAGFGYDPLFWSEELGQSFGTATPEEKGRVSHRGRAVAALLEALTR